jgi:hypothetical protein
MTSENFARIYYFYPFITGISFKSKSLRINQRSYGRKFSTELDRLLCNGSLFCICIGNRLGIEEVYAECHSLPGGREVIARLGDRVSIYFG